MNDKAPQRRREAFVKHSVKHSCHPLEGGGHDTAENRLAKQRSIVC